MKRIAEETLSRRGWLSRQPEPFRRRVFAECQLQQFERGAPIYHLGDPPGGAYGIAAGALAVSIAPGDRGPYFAHLGTAGTWFGEGPFLTGQPRRVGLEAATECVLMYLPLPAMERMAADDPMAIRRFAQIAIGNLDLALGVVADLMIGQPERRIAAVLVRSAGLQDERTVRLSQAELGRLANVSRKLVNRALQRFAAASMVLPRYGAVQILDMQALKQFSAGARQ